MQTNSNSDYRLQVIAEQCAYFDESDKCIFVTIIDSQILQLRSGCLCSLTIILKKKSMLHGWAKTTGQTDLFTDKCIEHLEFSSLKRAALSF